MATLRNKRKLAAVSRETLESSRSSRGQNVLDPELTQDYISQVSEEIEGRVTKKLSKEFSKTESRILGALSKPDEFLLNPQVRTCSVAVQGTSRNDNSENRETHGDRSSDNPYPEVGYFPHHSCQLHSPETETNSDMVTENYPHIQNYGSEMFHQVLSQQSVFKLFKDFDNSTSRISFCWNPETRKLSRSSHRKAIVDTQTRISRSTLPASTLLERSQSATFYWRKLFRKKTFSQITSESSQAVSGQSIVIL